MIIEVILLSLGVERLVELLKSAIPLPLISLYKTLVALGLSSLVTIPWAAGWREWSIATAGVWGVSAVTHSILRFLNAWSDAKRLDVILSQTPGRRPRVF